MIIYLVLLVLDLYLNQNGNFPNGVYTPQNLRTGLFIRLRCLVSSVVISPALNSLFQMGLSPWAPVELDVIKNINPSFSFPLKTADLVVFKERLTVIYGLLIT